TNADLGFSTLTNANFSGADLRGATGWSPDVTAITHNAILPDGSIQGLALLAGEKLLVRNNPISITVATSATLDNAATLEFLLDANWTSPVGFSAGLNPSLGGTLDLEIASGVDPSTLVGDSFQLFNWNGPLPAGDQFSMITTEPGLNWDLSNLYSAGTVTLIAVPEPSALLLASFGLAAVAAFASRRALGERLRLAFALCLN
ncbi:MAG TPA: PEP-CTERM sorting domain-containing protein, partial [Pirellulales bacterium]|nr:PEP-CTERM sorting domain-containing protein [Pirellulales bacterium]